MRPALSQPAQPVGPQRNAVISSRRPRLLMDAARHGVADYRRGRDLPRLLGAEQTTGPSVMTHLAKLEADMETARINGDPRWSCLRHVELLIAVLAERALHHAELRCAQGLHPVR